MATVLISIRFCPIRRQKQAFIACRAVSFFHSTYACRDHAEKVARQTMAKRGITEFQIRQV